MNKHQPVKGLGALFLALFLSPFAMGCFGRTEAEAPYFLGTCNYPHDTY
jgi:hypothetical protein